MKMSRIIVFLVCLVVVSSFTFAENIEEEKILTVIVNEDSVMVNVDGEPFLFAKNQSKTYTKKFNVSIDIEEDDTISSLDNDTILSISESITDLFMVEYNITDANHSEEMIKRVIERNDKMEHNLITKTKVVVQEFCNYDDLKTEIFEGFDTQTEHLTEKTDLEKQIQEEQILKKDCLSDLSDTEEEQKRERQINIGLLIALAIMIASRDGINVFRKVKEKVHQRKPVTVVEDENKR